MPRVLRYYGTMALGAGNVRYVVRYFFSHGAFFCIYMKVYVLRVLYWKSEIYHLDTGL